MPDKISNSLSTTDSLAAGGESLAQVAHSMSLFDLFWQADWLVKSIMFGLIFASIWSWTIIFDKTLNLSFVKKQINAFLNFFDSGASIEMMLNHIKVHKDVNPLSELLVTTINEWNKGRHNNNNNQQLNPSKEITEHGPRLDLLRERLLNTMDKTTDKIARKLEKNLVFLATVSNFAPFVGLFGTVWGIMVSFQSIAAIQNTSLAVVAPGIAEALLVTAVGLVAAIPASIFYNKFIADIDTILGKIEHFRVDLYNLLLRELELLLRDSEK